MSPMDLAVLNGHDDIVKTILAATHDATPADEYTARRKPLLQERMLAAEAAATPAPPPAAEAPSPDPANPPPDAGEEAAARAATSYVPPRPDEQKARFHKAEGNAHFVGNRLDAADAAYTAAIALAPPGPAVSVYYSNRAACRSRQGQHEEAAADAAAACALDPSYAKARFRLAHARLAVGRHEDAAVAAFEGLKIDPENDEMKSLLQRCVKKGRKEHLRKEREGKI